MDVRIDKEKLGEIVRTVEAEIEFDELSRAATELYRQIRAGPVKNYHKFKGLTEQHAEVWSRFFVSLERAAARINLADPSTNAGALKLEAATQILDQAVVFEGVFGKVVAERFDDDAIRFVLTLIVGLLNRALGHEWAEGLAPNAAAQE